MDTAQREITQLFIENYSMHVYPALRRNVLIIYGHYNDIIDSRLTQNF